MVAANAAAKPVLAAVWPCGGAPDERLLRAASATVNRQQHVGSGGQAAPSPYANDGVVALPLRRKNDSIGAVAFQMRAANADTHEQPKPQIQPAAPAPGTAVARPLPSATALLKLHASVHSAADFAQAAAAAASGLAVAFGCERVAIGLYEKGFNRVVALSSGTPAESGNALLQAIHRAMDEAVEQQATLVLPPAPGARARITLAHAELARRHDSAVCTIPLVRNGKIFGAITVQRARESPLGAAEIERYEQFVSLIGPALELMHRSERSWYARLLDTVKMPGEHSGKVALALLLMAAVAGLWAPVEHWVGAPARLEGAIQRALVAPTDGFLKSAHVRPGDTVRADQVLAEMVEQDLELEQKKLEAEIAQHENTVRGALSRGDRTLYAVSAAKSDAAAAQLAMIAEQRLRGRVRAPFDGVVIKGDLTQSLGAPVQRGEVLMTLAPSGTYRLIIEVDERDIAHLKAGQSGQLALSALPDSQVGWRVVRVTPVASARDGRNFFEVEGELDALPAGARPGLPGVAKIHIGEKTFGWVWGHRVYDWVRLRLWTLTG
ncbi:MAG: HlyD family efflux transporter periplasmic adaptor subunit [Burkholderiales bacterium]